MVGPDVPNRIRHTIDTVDARFFGHVPQRLAPSQREIADKEITKMLDQGTIESSDCLWEAPIILVVKKDETMRLCIDYRKLNNVMFKDAYPLPHIQDIVSGYYQIRMGDSVKQCSLHTWVCSVHARVMRFGLCGAPAMVFTGKFGHTYVVFSFNLKLKMKSVLCSEKRSIF